MTDLATLRDQLLGAEATVRSARLTLERVMQQIEAQRAEPAEPEPKKPPPTFGDSESHKPQES